MPKRKFQETLGSECSTNLGLSVSDRRQQQRLLGYLENGQSQLLGALKLARGFERQKLGRRQKDARIKSTTDGENKEVERIDAEIKALKALDLNNAAEFYIARTLCRIKTIASSLILPEQVRKKGDGRSPYQNAADANVTARLFKSTAVKNAMDSIEKHVREMVKTHGGKQQSAQNDGGMQSPETKNSSLGDWNGFSDSSNEDVQSAAYTQPNVEKVDSMQYDSLSSEDIGSHIDEDEDMQDVYEARLASDSNEDTDSAHESIVELGKGPRIVNKEVGVSISPSPKPVDGTKQKATVQATQAKAVSKTTFLPTLASGYISGSESESYESDISGHQGKPKQKNRMGQKARQALAEQKYGSAANHLKKSHGNKLGRYSGWDYKRGATDARGRGRGGRVRFSATTGHAGPQEQRKPAPRVKDDTGPLHPSWVAKKKMKEQQSSGAGAFQGKKVVFD